MTAVLSIMPAVFPVKPLRRSPLCGVLLRLRIPSFATESARADRRQSSFVKTAGRHGPLSLLDPQTQACGGPGCEHAICVTSAMTWGT